MKTYTVTSETLDRMIALMEHYHEKAHDGERLHMFSAGQSSGVYECIRLIQEPEYVPTLDTPIMDDMDEIKRLSEEVLK